MAWAILAAAWPHADVFAQGGGGVQPFRATVVSEPVQSDRVVVPVNHSVTIETTVPVARADIVAREIADVQVLSPTRLLVTGQSYGTTNIILMGTDNRQHVFEVHVELDLSLLRSAIAQIDPLAEVEAMSVQGHIVLTGTATSAERAKKIQEVAHLFLPPATDGSTVSTVQNHMTVAGEQQVLIRCIVAEVSRTAARELGVNGFLAGDDFRDAFAVNQLNGINPINIGAAADALVTDTIPFLTGEDGIPLTATPTISLGFPRVQMQLFIKAMAENSLLQVLAEPNLVAISGETATFLAGGEFPVPVPQGDDRVTIEFKEFGVRLNFTPVVLGGHRIRVRIAPEVSETDFTTAVSLQGLAIPGTKTRNAETTVEIGSGQTLAIAGLLSENVRGVASRVPGVGDIPVLGALFRSVQYQRAMTELVILVTPEIVAPLDAHQKPRIPGMDHVPPSDLDLYTMGILDGKNDNEGGKNGNTNDGESDAITLLPSQPDELSVHGPWGHVWAQARADYRP